MASRRCATSAPWIQSFPTVDLRNALNAGLVEAPRLIVAAHIISASAGHGDLRGFYPSRWDLPVSAIADGTETGACSPNAGSA